MSVVDNPETTELDRWIPAIIVGSVVFVIVLLIFFITWYIIAIKFKAITELLADTRRAVFKTPNPVVYGDMNNNSTVRFARL